MREYNVWELYQKVAIELKFYIFIDVLVLEWNHMIQEGTLTLSDCFYHR